MKSTSVAIIVIAGWSVYGVQMPFVANAQPASTCERNYRGLSYKFNAQRRADKINIELELLHAAKPQKFGFLVFTGDKQIVYPDIEALSLECGGIFRKAVGLTKTDASNTVNVLVQELPLIPQKILQATAPLTGIEPGFIDYVTRRSDFKTLNLKSTAPPPARFAAKRVVAKFRDGYLFFTDQQIPDHVFYASKNTLGFGVYFSDVASDKSKFYTVTCLVNNQQISAFAGGRSWTGTLVKGEGVVLMGTAKLKKGWNALQCVVLNNIYGDKNGASLYPNLIRSSFVFVK